MAIPLLLVVVYIDAALLVEEVARMLERFRDRFFFCKTEARAEGEPVVPTLVGNG